ncbi:MAG: arylamine N-acetyltransferase [Betaproteobacteria bacterium]
MPNPLRLDAYLERIQWGGPVAPTFATLAALLRAHMTRIPFENLDVLLGRPVRLDLDSLQQKLIDSRRGGYCFEHATLFAAVLVRFGFAIRTHSARVTVTAPRTEMPRTHMLLTVALPEGIFIADPGFGGLAPIMPVPLVERADAAAEDESATHWMVKSDDHWILRTRTPDKLVDCWATMLEEDYPVDFTMANHYVSTHPSSSFANRMLLRAITGEGSVSVMNRDVTVRRGEVSETTKLADRAALRAVLAKHFGFDLPEVERMRVPAIPEWE